MHVYKVKIGDTPASIAAKDTHAGCPKCSIDLIRANPHKKTVKHRNGYVTFESIRVGEELRLPDRWFDGTLDRLPKEYFVNLPHPDGVTPSKIGIGADYTVDIGPATMDPLVAKTIPAILVTTAQAAYTTLDKDPDYCASVARVGTDMRPVNRVGQQLETATCSPTPEPQIPVLVDRVLMPATRLADQVGTNRGANQEPVALLQAVCGAVVSVAGNSRLPEAVVSGADVMGDGAANIGGALAHRLDIARFELVVGVEVDDPLGIDRR